MHKYPFIYKYCDSTFGYDELIERLGKDNQIFLEALDANCMKNGATILNHIYARGYNELVDFLDGNGFSINYLFDNSITYIKPIEKENIE